MGNGAAAAVIQQMTSKPPKYIRCETQCCDMISKATSSWIC